MPDLPSHEFSTIISTVLVHGHKKTPVIIIVVNTDILEPYTTYLQSLLVSTGIEYNNVCGSKYDLRNRTCVVLSK